jgi:tetratricopeptide (TPR) repeat protein
MHPSIEETILKRADALCTLHRYEEAIAETQKVLALSPQHRIALGIQGQCLIRSERYNEALEVAQKLRAAEPEWAYAHYVYGFVQAKLHKLVQAEASLRKALQLDTDYPDCYGCLSIVLYNQNRLDEAFSVARTGLSFDPRHKDCLNALALVFSNRNEKAKLIQTTTYLLQVGTEKESVYYNVGLAFKNIGEPQIAIRYFQEALRLDPQNKQAQSELGGAIAQTFPVYSTLHKYVRKSEYYTSDYVQERFKQKVKSLCIKYRINLILAKSLSLLLLLLAGLLVVITILPLMLVAVLYLLSGFAAYVHTYYTHRWLFPKEDVQRFVYTIAGAFAIILFLILSNWINAHTH